MKTLKLLFCVVVTNLAGLIGTVFTMPAIPSWYANLNRPSFSPPNWIFGPVWTLLYLLMGISLFLVWESKSSKVKQIGIWAFIVQLFFNAIWSPIFFGAQNTGLAFIVICFLWVSILVTIYYFWKIHKIASYLLFPYILWVSFAAILNFSIWWLN